MTVKLDFSFRHWVKILLILTNRNDSVFLRFLDILAALMLWSSARCEATRFKSRQDTYMKIKILRVTLLVF